VLQDEERIPRADVAGVLGRNGLNHGDTGKYEVGGV
jgi:hypothetical protein